MTKTSKTSFNAATFTSLGFKTAHGDAEAIALVKALAKKSVEAAKGSFQTGYVAGRLYPQASELTPDMIAKAQALIKATGATSKGTVKPGSFRRSADQEKMYLGARVAWSRLSKDAGIVRADRRGGARRRKEEPKGSGEGKPEGSTKTVKLGKVASAKDLASNVHTFKGAWAALMVSSKSLTLPSEASDKAIKIATLLNELEGALAKL